MCTCNRDANMAAQFSEPSKRRKVTGKACAVAECTCRHSDGISLHKFPKNPQQRQHWTDFVRTCRADFGSNFGTPNDNSFICERHFTSDAYPMKLRLSTEFGIIPKLKTLNPGAVPTIQKHLHSSTSSRKLTVNKDNGRPTTSGSCSTTVTTACSWATTTATTVHSSPISSALPDISAVRGAHAKRKRKRVSSRKLPQDGEDAWHRTVEKNRVGRRKLVIFNTHNSCSIAEEDHPAIFCQKHLTMPAASVLLHDYDGAIAIDSSKVVELSNGLDANVTQQSQRRSSRRTVTHKNQQRPSRRRRTHSRSKSLSQDSDQTEAGDRSNSQQESPESKQMSAVKIEIDIADDPAQLWMRESSSQVSGHCRSAVPHVQVMQTEPDGEYNCHSDQCQEAVTEELASHEYSMDVKQEKDRDLCSCNQELSTEQLHAFELGTEIKQKIDRNCSHSEDISTKQYLAGELEMEIKHEKNMDVHQDSSQCHESELCTGIKQEKDTDVGFACESFISEQFQACDYKVDAKIKQEKDMGYAEAFSSEQYYPSKFGIEIKQEVDLDELTQ